MLNPPAQDEETRVNATWYQMYIAVAEPQVEKHPHHGDLFEACVIREAAGVLLDKKPENEFAPPPNEKLNFTGRAMVGLIVNEVEWIQWQNEVIPEAELEEMYYKLKIYACDDLDATYKVGG